MIPKDLQGFSDFFLHQLRSFFSAQDPKRLIPEAQKSGFVESYDGTSIYWELHGPSPENCEERPMVFCYGLACSMNQWRMQIERYAPQRPCLLLDYRGHHKSAYPSDPRSMNMSALAKDVACVIRAQNFKHCPHIWAHSMGVNVALELAVAEPALCRTLILCCGTHLSPFKKMFGTDFLEKIVTPLLYKYPNNVKIFDTLWNLFSFRSEPTELLARLAGFNMSASTLKDVRSYAKAATSIPAHTFFPLLLELARGSTRGILKKVRTRSYVVAGSLDRVTPPDNQQLLCEILPNAKYIEIAAGSHNVQLDFGEYLELKLEELWRAENLW